MLSISSGMSWREEIVAAAKFPLAAYFGHSYLVTGVDPSPVFLDVEHRYICENPLKIQ